MTLLLLRAALYRLFIAGTLSVLSILSHANSNIQLPSIGPTSYATLSEEKRIGDAWLKQYRRQVSTSTDPIITHYIEKLLNTLAAHSEVEHKQLSLVIAKNNTLNAFAVPGGIIGVHTGLLNYAKTEQQFASVLAHELAHLSQKHYARGVEKRKRQAITTMAALLASIVLAANSGGDAGAAAISATQAFAIDQQLRFSRSFEREADRIGMDILVKAGMNPHAVSEMFQQMNRATRFSSKPPEFLLTHPLTTSRIVDAINLSRQYPQQVFTDNINYQLIRYRAIWISESEPEHSISRFKKELKGLSLSPEGARYGLALALSSNQQYSEAQETITPLLMEYPENTILRLLESDILAKQGQYQEASKILKKLDAISPNYYPIQAQWAQLYNDQKALDQAIDTLSSLTEQRPEDPLFWHDLAETAGLNNDISILNKARAEYFILLANFDNARQQLASLRKREGNQSPLGEYATQRLSELERLEKLSEL